MAPPAPTRETLSFPLRHRDLIDRYLPPQGDNVSNRLPFVTLTYACSMDSMIAISPGKPTPISGPMSKAMTHYLRSKHDAIVVGVGTAVADNPTLNSRLDEIVEDGLLHQPQPVVLDRNARWAFTRASKVVTAAHEGKGKPPWIIVSADKKSNISTVQAEALRDCGGEHIYCSMSTPFLEALKQRDIHSVMIEGGASVLNDMLNNHRSAIDSVIVTLAPQLFGQGGVQVCPKRQETDGEDVQQPALKFTNVQWLPLHQDVVMCGNLK